MINSLDTLRQQAAAQDALLASRLQKLLTPSRQPQKRPATLSWIRCSAPSIVERRSLIAGLRAEFNAQTPAAYRNRPRSPRAFGGIAPPRSTPPSITK